MYDFILFENQQGAFNHYKDLCLISQMLIDSGYTVAIANLYEEKKYCVIDNVPIIEFANKKPVPNRSWVYHTKNRFYSFFSAIKYIYQQHFYIKEFLKNIRGMANNYYVGSYHTLVSSLLFKEATDEHKVFIWGLRSSRISGFRDLVLSDPIGALNYLHSKECILGNKNLFFFVSNEIIRNEFINLGISSKRLIIREERFFNEKGPDRFDNRSQNFTLLTFGLLRESKRILFLIESFKRVASEDDVFIIAGKCLHENYSLLITKAIGNDKRIKRINAYIDEAHINELFQQCHYLLLGDIKDKSVVSNGTMLEAFICKRPIIAPNYDPYRYYVDKFSIGLLYDDRSITSLESTITQGKKLQSDYFKNNIMNYLSTITYEECLNRFRVGLYTAIKPIEMFKN